MEEEEKEVEKEEEEWEEKIEEEEEEEKEQEEEKDGEEEGVEQADLLWNTPVPLCWWGLGPGRPAVTQRAAMRALNSHFHFHQRWNTVWHQDQAPLAASQS